MRFFDFLRSIKRKMSGHLPLIKVFIYKNNLLHNLAVYQKQCSPIKIAPVLKSNAYGHGLIEVARILDKQDIPFLVVDSAFEALVLRSAGVKSKVLVIGYTRPEELPRRYWLRQTSFTIIGLEQLKAVAKIVKHPINLHLKFDTGMHRQGLLISEKEKAIQIFKQNKNLKLEGICSHLADADSSDKDFTLQQIYKWNNLVKEFKKYFSDIQYFHLTASPGIKFLNKIDSNVARIGFGLYGFNPVGQNLDLQPVLEMRAIITSIRKISANEKVGYNITFTADKPMTIATVSAGYFEGIDRRLSNKGFVKIKDKFCPILGRISMNIISIDVSEIPDIKIGDEVMVISKNLADKNCAKNMAQICQTICYEILVHIPQHLKRIIK